MLGLLLTAGLSAAVQDVPAPPATAPHAFVITGAGRFAQAADLASLTRDGDTARMRVLQVADRDFHVGQTAYWGGWSWWAPPSATWAI